MVHAWAHMVSTRSHGVHVGHTQGLAMVHMQSTRDSHVVHVRHTWGVCRGYTDRRDFWAFERADGERVGWRRLECLLESFESFYKGFVLVIERLMYESREYMISSYIL